MPTDTEISTMETFVEVLKPIVDITEAIGGEKLATVSTIKALLHELLLMHLIFKKYRHSSSKNNLKVMLNDLKSRYDTVELNKNCLVKLVCWILDSRLCL